jgi:hypothetical protein
MGVFGAPKWSVSVDMGTLPAVDRMRGNVESMPVLYGWLEVQIPARWLTRRSLEHISQTPNWWKSCDFFDTVRHQFEKEAVYSTKQETYYRVLAET